MVGVLKRYVLPNHCTNPPAGSMFAAADVYGRSQGTEPEKRKVISDPRFWARDFREVTRERITAFRKVAEQRILTAFDNLSDEARAVEDSEAERITESKQPEEVDIVAVAEEAFERSTDWYVTMSTISQGVTNLLAVALYHLFEQLLLEFYRLEFLNGSPSNADRRLRSLLARLSQEGIDCGRFESWSKVNELRLVANTVKHGEGESCRDLRLLRPELFEHPSIRSERAASERPELAVYNPLYGEGIYVTKKDLGEYFGAVEGFCSEIASALESQAPCSNLKDR